MGLLAVSGTVLYQPLQSNLKWHVKHRMQPFTFVSSCDSPQFGHTVASLDFAGRVGSAEQSASLQIMAVEFTIRVHACAVSKLERRAASLSTHASRTTRRTQ